VYGAYGRVAILPRWDRMVQLCKIQKAQKSLTHRDNPYRFELSSVIFSGSFLFAETKGPMREIHVWSRTLAHTYPLCKLQASFCLANMTMGSLKVVIETKNMSYVIDEKYGNNRNT